MKESDINAFGILLIILLAGCDTSDTTVDSVENQTEKVPVIDPENMVHLSLDEQFAEMARNIEGFGGLYLDESGRLNIYLKDPSTQLDQAIQILPSRYQYILGYEIASKTYSLEVHEGKYDFLELKEWKDASLNVMSIDGVLSLDIDERENRLVIGIHDIVFDQVRSAVEEFMGGLGIPGEAITVVAEKPVRFLANLAQKVRPMKGGLQIGYEYSIFQGSCTMGFLAERTSEQLYGFVTNSHCSASYGSVDDVEYFQDDAGEGSEYVGFEHVDPSFFYSGDCGGAKRGFIEECPCGRYCRRSDALFVAFDENITGNDISFGKLEKTTYRGSSTGSITIDGDFTINAEAPSHILGTELNKMGSNTGWTYGDITSTCKDRNPSGTNITFLCQYDVDAGSGGGDSGSPVFYWDGSSSTVTLYGILWGAVASGDFVYSPISSVKSELGPLAVY